MKEVFAYLMLVVVLALVARSMARLTEQAAGDGILRPATVRIMLLAPMIAYGVWAGTLALRMVLQPEIGILWPFELAASVMVWLCWIAAIALIATLVEGWRRLFRSRTPDGPPQEG